MLPESAVITFSALLIIWRALQICILNDDYVGCGYFLDQTHVRVLDAWVEFFLCRSEGEYELKSLELNCIVNKFTFFIALTPGDLFSKYLAHFLQFLPLFVSQKLGVSGCTQA